MGQFTTGSSRWILSFSTLPIKLMYVQVYSYFHRHKIKMYDIMSFSPNAQMWSHGTLAYGCCHLVLVMSSAARVYAVAAEKWRCGINVQIQMFALITELSCQTWCFTLLLWDQTGELSCHSPSFTVTNPHRGNYAGKILNQSKQIFCHYFTFTTCDHYRAVCKNFDTNIEEGLQNSSNTKQIFHPVI